MRAETLAGILMALAADPARTRRDREALHRALVETGNADREDAPVSCAEAARMMNRSRSTVHAFARRGILRKVRLPGLSQHSGFMRSDIGRLAEYIAGRGNP